MPKSPLAYFKKYAKGLFTFAKRCAKIIFILGLASFGIVVTVLLGIVIKRTYEYYFGFERQEWLDTPDVLKNSPSAFLDNPRESMVQDVMAHELKPNMSRQAVIILLGQPDGTYLSGSNTPVVMYQVGWSFLDPDYLVLNFTHDGKLVKYQVENH